jgi:hypothetical protein
MRKLLAVLCLVVLSASTAFAKAPRQSFSNWGDFLVGGVWTGTDAQGVKHEQRWEWVLSKSFLQATWSITGDSGLTIFGIDPSSGQVTWWGFDEEGRIWKGSTTIDDDGWADMGTGQGKSGANSWTAKFIKLGDDNAKLEIEENVVDGKAFPPEVVTLTRSK